MDPAEKIAIFRIPGAWEEEGFKILEKYGVEYADRSVSHARGRQARGREDRSRCMSILVDADTTFIVQGITGREAVNLTRECLDYGTGAKVVGGVTPGRLGREVHGVPVFDTVAQAVEHHGRPIDGSVVTVPAGVHQGRGLRGDRERHQADRHRHRAHPAPRRRADGRARRRCAARASSARTASGSSSPTSSRWAASAARPRTPRSPTRPAPIGVISRSGGMTTEMSSTLTRRRPRASRPRSRSAATRSSARPTPS